MIIDLADRSRSENELEVDNTNCAYAQIGYSMNILDIFPLLAAATSSRAETAYSHTIAHKNPAIKARSHVRL